MIFGLILINVLNLVYFYLKNNYLLMLNNLKKTLNEK
jgi:hypothetical protein